MKKRCLLIAICLFLTPLFVGKSIAWEFTTKSPKLASLSTTDDGLAFKLKFKNDLTPNAPLCKNEFLLPNNHPEYNLLAALLMTASAQKKKVDVEYDETSDACLVEIKSIVIF